MDNKKKKGYQDDSKIDTKDSNEMEYWKKELGMSGQQIAGAIKVTGTNGVKKIKEYLKNKK